MGKLRECLEAKNQGRETMRVIDIISAAEYVGCDIVDAFGNSLTDGKSREDIEKLYEKTVEHIDAKDNCIRIFTFVNFDEMCKLNTAEKPKKASGKPKNISDTLLQEKIREIENEIRRGPVSKYYIEYTRDASYNKALYKVLWILEDRPGEFDDYYEKKKAELKKGEL